ncbi:zf-MYND-domain-containing protein [Coniophora puteana RWD-64-598 SS2]|uniref:Zf-MYND-domain-containing protein n=1 Tax=Coniophora puteana (strain RWD-64-598) TaxID=741705 RepID=A0A5M3N3Y4_CONPW|nr:zf-MYND-domain-containing protein [Coniophora puteana RWD-64-598 SS2]EIW85734.1 zf-MYND-domain-containing protein [Coniophora puteana RWD-64-598 SS2]
MPTNSSGDEELVVLSSHLIKGCVNCDRYETPDQKLLSCLGCGKVRYCSKECQLAHWLEHKVPCKLNRQAAQSSKTREPDGGRAAHEFGRWVQLNNPVFTVALYHALGLEADLNAYKTRGVVVQFASKPNRLNYPMHQRYNVTDGFTEDLDTIIQSMPPRLANPEELKQTLKGSRPTALILLFYDRATHVLKLHLPSLQELRDAAEGVDKPVKGDWLKWLDKAISNNFQDTIKLPKPFR